MKTKLEQSNNEEIRANTLFCIDKYVVKKMGFATRDEKIVIEGKNVKYKGIRT